jgi:nucleotidyltransferase/DNA polymerase involved in DNA repair
VVPGITARTAHIRCPQARLVEADLPACRQALETLLGVLERTSSQVEPHGWGAAYVDLGDLARNRTGATAICSETGRAIRHELGAALQPALGWDSSKFTAQAAAHRTRPGRLLAIAAAQERTFLDPLPVQLLPLAQEPLRRLRFLGLRTLGQYAALPTGAVWQQFGRAGVMAQRCALGCDDRPVVSRDHAPRLVARAEYEAPLAERARLRTALQRLVAPLVQELHEELRACGQMRLTIGYEKPGAVSGLPTASRPMAAPSTAPHVRRPLQEERTRAFVLPTASERRLLDALDALAAQASWPAPVTALEVALEQLQDATCQMEQLSFLPSEDGREEKLRQVQHYLATRFGAHCLRRAILAQPNAPLPEWRVGWDEVEEPT